MFSVRIIAAGQEWDPDNKGLREPCPVGTIITHHEALNLCLPGYRNAPPIAEPADEATKAALAERLTASAPRKAAVLADLQNKINALAHTPGLGLVFDSKGQPARDDNGEIKGKLSNLQRHRLETALSYGLTPVITPPKPPAPAAAPASTSSV